MSGDRYIKVVGATFTNPSAISLAAACRAGFGETRDTDGRIVVMTISTLDWFGDENPWSIPNDLSFAVTQKKGRAAQRLIDAAEECARTDASYLKLSAGDYEEHVKPVLNQPQLHPQSFPLPAAINRALATIFEAIETASTENPEEAPVEVPRALQAPEKPTKPAKAAKPGGKAAR